VPEKSRNRTSQTQLRQARRARRERKQRFRRWLSIAGLGSLGIVIIAGLALSGIPPRQNTGFERSLDGPGTVMSDQGREHLEVGARVPVGYYNSTPPTSGDHAPDSERCGSFESAIAPEVQVHNLEHGFVIINYDLEEQDQIDELTQLAEGLPGWPNYYILAPYPDLEQPVTLTAWTTIQGLETVDGDAIRTFANAYRSFGPEPGAPAC
jgi:hypothetical protein